MITAPSLCLSGEIGETGRPTMGAVTGSETTAARKSRVQLSIVATSCDVWSRSWKTVFVKGEK
jgi:hypothetical protein